MKAYTNVKEILSLRVYPRQMSDKIVPLNRSLKIKVIVKRHITHHILKKIKINLPIFGLA